MKKFSLLIILSGTVLFSCTSKKVATTEKSSAEVVAEIKKNYNEQQLEEGHTLWQNNCNKCHKLYEPSEYTVSRWENILPRMLKRAKLDDEQSGKVRAYVLSNSKG